MHFAHYLFKIAMIMSPLPGKAVEWVTAIWKRAWRAARTYERFTTLYKAMFDHPAEE